MTLRRRLLFGGLIVAALLVAVVLVSEAVLLRGLVYTRTASGLHESARTALRIAPPGADGFTSHSASLLIDHVAGHGIAVAVLTKGGELLDASLSAPDGDPASFAVPVQEISSDLGAGNYAVISADQRRLLVVRVPVSAGGDAGSVLMAIDTAGDDATVASALEVTALAAIAALLIAAIVAVPVLRSALSPLHHMATTADAIADGDLDRRAGLSQSRDEVGLLARAFDRMVDQLLEAGVERELVVEELRHNQAAMQNLLADVSHELRTPVTAIRGAAEVLLRGAADDPTYLAESLAHIDAESVRMSALVDDLLLLARSDGQPIRAGEPLDLLALLEQARARLDVVASPHPVLIEGASAWVMGDGEALLRLFSNLVDNAARYSPGDSPIEVRVAEEAAHAAVGVRDHGPGIAENDRERIFERFARGDPTRTRVTGGTGLGLAIVRRIAEDHRGTVSVTDPPGGGALFTVTLPRTGSTPTTTEA